MGDYLHEVNVCNFVFGVGSRQQLFYLSFVDIFVRINEKYDVEFWARNAATYCTTKPK